MIGGIVRGHRAAAQRVGHHRGVAPRIVGIRRGDEGARTQQAAPLHRHPPFGNLGALPPAVGVVGGIVIVPEGLGLERLVARERNRDGVVGPIVVNRPLLHHSPIDPQLHQRAAVGAGASGADDDLLRRFCRWRHTHTQRTRPGHPFLAGDDVYPVEGRIPHAAIIAHTVALGLDPLAGNLDEIHVQVPVALGAPGRDAVVIGEHHVHPIAADDALVEFLAILKPDQPAAAIGHVEGIAGDGALVACVLRPRQRYLVHVNRAAAGRGIMEMNAYLAGRVRRVGPRHHHPFDRWNDVGTGRTIIAGSIVQPEAELACGTRGRPNPRTHDIRRARNQAAAVLTNAAGDASLQLHTRATCEGECRTDRSRGWSPKGTPSLCGIPPCGQRRLEPGVDHPLFRAIVVLCRHVAIAIIGVGRAGADGYPTAIVRRPRLGHVSRVGGVGDAIQSRLERGVAHQVLIRRRGRRQRDIVEPDRPVDGPISDQPQPYTGVRPAVPRSLHELPLIGLRRPQRQFARNVAHVNVHPARRRLAIDPRRKDIRGVGSHFDGVALGARSCSTGGIVGGPDGPVAAMHPVTCAHMLRCPAPEQRIAAPTADEPFAPHGLCPLQQVVVPIVGEGFVLPPLAYFRIHDESVLCAPQPLPTVIVHRLLRPAMSDHSIARLAVSSAIRRLAVQTVMSVETRIGVLILGPRCAPQPVGDLLARDHVTVSVAVVVGGVDIIDELDPSAVTVVHCQQAWIAQFPTPSASVGRVSHTVAVDPGIIAESIHLGERIRSAVAVVESDGGQGLSIRCIAGDAPQARRLGVLNPPFEPRPFLDHELVIQVIPDDQVAAIADAGAYLDAIDPIHIPHCPEPLALQQSFLFYAIVMVSATPVIVPICAAFQDELYPIAGGAVLRRVAPILDPHRMLFPVEGPPTVALRFPVPVGDRIAVYILDPIHRPAICDIVRRVAGVAVEVVPIVPTSILARQTVALDRIVGIHRRELLRVRRVAETVSPATPVRDDPVLAGRVILRRRPCRPIAAQLIVVPARRVADHQQVGGILGIVAAPAVVGQLFRPDQFV